MLLLVLMVHVPFPLLVLLLALHACCRYGARSTSASSTTLNNAVFQVLYVNNPALDDKFWYAWQTTLIVIMCIIAFPMLVWKGWILSRSRRGSENADQVSKQPAASAPAVPPLFAFPSGRSSLPPLGPCSSLVYSPPSNIHSPCRTSSSTSPLPSATLAPGASPWCCWWSPSTTSSSTSCRT